MKILSIDDMLEAAMNSGMPGYEADVKAMEAAATHLAMLLSIHLGIKSTPGSWEGKDFAGLCCGFYPSKKGQKCPKVIDEGDPGGDWEMPVKL